MSTDRKFGSFILVLSAALFCGCATHTDLVSQGSVKVERLNSQSFTLGEPRVYDEVGTLHVQGDVYRPSFSPIRGSGHVDVRLVDADGREVHSTTAKYAVPPGRSSQETPGPRIANYHARVPGPLPENATVRVAICSAAHPPANVQE